MKLRLLIKWSWGVEIIWNICIGGLNVITRILNSGGEKQKLELCGLRKTKPVVFEDGKGPWAKE